MTREPERLSAKTWMMIGALILFFPLVAAVVSVVKNPHKAELGILEKYGTQGVKFEPGKQKVSESLSNTKYPDDRWDPMVLQIIEDGPKLLSKDTDFQIEPPPGNTSAETERDLNTLRSYAKNLRSPEQLALVHSEYFEMKRMYDPFEKGGLFISASNKDTVDLLDMAQIELSYFVLKLKRDFLRPRPDTLAPDLQVAIEVPKHASYPSGHAAQGYMTGLIFALVDPAHADQYKAMGFDIGLRREIAGVHYPTDSIAGRKLAQAVLDKLMEVPAFTEQLEKARKSFVAADEAGIASYKPVDVTSAGENTAE